MLKHLLIIFITLVGFVFVVSRFQINYSRPLLNEKDEGLVFGDENWYEGILRVRYEDDFKAKSSRKRYYIDTGSSVIELKDVSDDGNKYVSSQKVKVKGKKQGDSISLEGKDDGLKVVSSADTTGYSSGNNQVAVIKV